MQRQLLRHRAAAEQKRRPINIPEFITSLCTALRASHSKTDPVPLPSALDILGQRANIDAWMTFVPKIDMDIEKWPRWWEGKGEYQLTL